MIRPPTDCATMGQVRAGADAASLPGDAIADLCDYLLEASIAYELATSDRLKPSTA